MDGSADRAGITRRCFVGAALVGVAGIVTAATGCAAPSSKAPAAGTPSSVFGNGGAMDRRVLVAYATRNGSTVGVAERIGETLGTMGAAVDVRPLAEKPSLDGYDAVVLGSAINGAAWLPEALEYVQANRIALAARPVAVFCVHAMNCGTSEAETAKRRAYLDAVRAALPGAAEGFFAGKGPSAADTSWLALWAFRAFGGHVIEGDGRDWPKIEAWARGLHLADS